MPTSPIVLSTWKFGLPANIAAWDILSANGGRALDAVERGVRNAEADVTVSSVGKGGLPDADGVVSLDAAIMDENGNFGAVGFLQNITHAVSVARAIMEKSNHNFFVGEGAYRFAQELGLPHEELLTAEAKERWIEWKKTQEHAQINWENHDTIGMIARDDAGNFSAACTTSGLAWKEHARVGDSPIVGAGLFVDNSVGAATATGRGECVMKMCGSFLIVEFMRNGMSPFDACKNAVQRIVETQKDADKWQVGFLAIDVNGDYGAYALKPGFQYAVSTAGEHRLLEAEHWFSE